MKKNNFKTEFEFLKKNLKSIRINFIYLVLCYIGFFAFSMVAFLFWNLSVSKLTLQLSYLQTAPIEQTVQIMQNAISRFVVYAILLLVFLFINWSFFKSFFFKLLMKNKYTPRYFGRFCWLNLIWLMVLAIISAIVFYIMYLLTDFRLLLVIFFMAYLMIISYLDAVLFAVFIKENSILKALKKTFSNIIEHFSFAFFFALVVLIILSLITMLFSRLPFYTYISLFFIIIYFSWLNYYFISILNSKIFKKKKRFRKKKRR